MKKLPKVKLSKNHPEVLQDYVDYAVRNYDEVGRLLSNVMKINKSTHLPKHK